MISFCIFKISKVFVCSKFPKVNLAILQFNCKFGPMETRIKTQFGPIRYERSTNFPLQEGAFLSQSIKEAFIYLSSSLSKLKKGEIDENLVNSLFNDNKELLQILESLIEKFKNKALICKKERAYSDSEGNTDTSVLASVSEGGEIKIYNAFFNTKEIKDNRAGVIIHEASHLAGLEGESNVNETTANPNSAEAVKNFCLCACDKLSLEEINREKESPENSKDEEPTYRPDQPRAPKGQSDGGQWISEGGGSGESSKTGGSESKKTNSDSGGSSNINNPENIGSSSKTEGNPPNGAISKTLRFGKIGEDRNSTGESVDFKDTFKVGDYNYEDNIEGPKTKSGIWSAFDFSDSEYKPESDVTVIVRLEFEHDEKKCIDVAYDAKSDKNGCVKIDRISIVDKINEPGWNSIADTDGNLDIRMKISSVEGRPKEVFGSDNIIKNPLPSTDIRYYAQLHASSDKKSTYAQRDKADGGVIKNYTKNPKEKEIYSGAVRINLYEERLTEIDSN